MLKVSAVALHEFLQIGANDVYGSEKWNYDTYLDNLNELHDDENPQLTEETFHTLQAMDIKQIVADSSMSENHIGGDDVIAYIDEVVAAIKEGYEIITWYGPKAQVLVIGVRPNTLEIE